MDRTPSKATITNKLARLGHFPPGSQAGRLAGPVFYVYVCIFSGRTSTYILHLSLSWVKYS
jgi:hypothetical protein